MKEIAVSYGYSKNLMDNIIKEKWFSLRIKDLLMAMKITKLNIYTIFINNNKNFYKDV